MAYFRRVDGDENNVKRNNVEYLKQQIETDRYNTRQSNEIQKFNASTSRLYQDKEKQKTQRELIAFMRKDGVDPYDNTPGGKRVPGDKLLAISQSKYSNSLLEKILKASDQTQFQNTTLKFQEQALNYMQSISTDIKAIAESLKPKEEEQQQEEENELKMEMSNLAKSLASLDIEGIAKDIGTSVYKKLDSSGYGDLVKSMYQSMRETIQGGDFSQMVKGMLQSTMLSTLPPEWQKNIQQFRDDPVKLMQLQINKLGKGDNKVLRDIFGSMYQGEKPGEGLQRKKIDLSAKALFDNKVYTSITKVIPEYLYRIVRGIEGGDSLMYDWQEQRYITASEASARAAQNNAQVSPEQLRREMMSSLSTILEEAADNNNNDIIKMLEIDPQTKKLVKDKITGNVKFKNQNIGKVLTKILDSGFMIDDIITSPTGVIIQSVSGLSNDPENYQYINTIKTILRSSGMEDKDEFVELMHDLRERKTTHKYDDSAEFLGNKYNDTVQHLMKNTTMSADQRDRILGMLNSQGVHVWGNGGGYGPGSGGNGSNTFSGGGNSTTTNWDAVDAERNNPDNKIDSDRDRDKARDWESKLINMKLSNVDPYREKESERDKFTAKLSNLYATGLIDETRYSRWKAKGPEGVSSKENLYIKERLKKFKGASELYKTLEDAQMTAQHIAAQRGITVEAARAQGYVADITDLVDCIDKNGNPIIAKLREKNYTYLDPRSEDWKYIRKKAAEERRGVLGNGPINKQISRTLSGIFGDPKIADKAGIAVGSAAGLGVAKLLKDQGIITNPKFGYVMAGLGGALMSMERSRNFMTNVFGPEGDVRGANGFSNKEIFMAKAMTQYLPALGIGGKTALSIMKATKAFGPLGQAFGLIAGPALGTVVGITGAAAANHFRKWLFDPERDPNSKLGKVVSFLKENRFIRRMFAMSDDRSDEALQLDALKRLRGMYESKLNEEKAKQTPSKSKIQAINKALKAIDDAEVKIKENLTTIKAEQKKSTKDDETPDQNRIDACNNAIATIFRHLMNKLKQIDDVVGFTSQSEFDAFVEEEKDERENTNRASAAADASYNKIDPDRMDRYKEIATEYYNASDENKTRFREAVRGEGDLILDTIRDDNLRSEFEAMSIEADAGTDVSARYQAWVENFKTQDPNGYEAFIEATRGGVNATEFRQKLYDAIRKDMKEVEKTKLTGQELEDEVTRRGNMILNDRHFVNKLLGVASDTKFNLGQALRGRFGFEGVDEDDKRRDNLAMNLVNMYTRNNPDYQDNSDLEDEDEEVSGAGGRGDKPIKMRQLSGKKFKSGESLSVAGCSVAAITNALVYMGIDAPEPDTLIGIANKYLTKSGGITSDFFKEVGEKLGVSVLIYNEKDNKFTVDSFKSIKPGKGFGSIVLLRNQFNEGFHYVTIKSVNGRTLTVDDPEVNGIQKLAAAEIVSRLVEIITLKQEGAKSLVKETDKMSFKDMIKSTIKSKVTNAISKSGVGKMASDVVGGPLSTGSIVSGMSGGSSIISQLLDALNKAVFNIRIVDDLTLPLKMGDPDAALAVSRQQLSNISDNSIKKYANNIKKTMNNKDVQAELNQQNLVQEKILEGGLVAGESSGSGGKGSGINGAENQTPGDTLNLLDKLKSLKNLGVKGVLAKVLGKAGPLLPALAGFLGYKAFSKFKKMGDFRLGNAYKNMFGEITEDTAEQKFDAEGNQTQQGLFRDVSGSIRNVKDATNLYRGGVAAWGLVGAGFKNVMKKAAGTQLFGNMAKKALGEGAKGFTGLIVKAINKAFIDLPIWLGDVLLKSDALAKLAGGAEPLKDMLMPALNSVKEFGKKIGSRFAKAFAGRAAAEAGKKGLLKKVFGMIPGSTLLVAAVQAPFAVITGYKKAHRYLGKSPDQVGFGTRILMALAKLIWDIGPDILIGLAGVSMPPLQKLGNIALAVFRTLVSFEDILTLFGIKKELTEDEKARNKAYQDEQNKIKAAEKGEEEKDSKNTEVLDDKERKEVEKTVANVGQSTTAMTKQNTASTSATSSDTSYNHKVITESKNYDPAKVQVKDKSMNDFVGNGSDPNNVSSLMPVNDKESEAYKEWAKGAKGMIPPVKNVVVTSAFGPRNVSGASNPHKGVDLRAKFGDPIYAAEDGIVTMSGGQYGTIMIKHKNGEMTRYLHNSKLLVKTGDVVRKGQVIAQAGGQGPKGPHHYNAHLHFETWEGGVRKDPFIRLGLDPSKLKETAENFDYLKRNPFLQEKATALASKIEKVDTTKPTVNTEAGGPSPNEINNVHTGNMTVVNEDRALKQYVQTLDAKFDKMIELLSKLVSISDENANNFMSEAIAPARI